MFFYHHCLNGTLLSQFNNIICNLRNARPVDLALNKTANIEKETP